MAVFQKVDPLTWDVPIVDPETGKPSPQFIRIWQQMFMNGDATQGGLESKADKSTQIIAGTGLDGGGDLSANVTIDLADTSVTPGSYTNTNLTVDQQGRITAAANGSGGGGGATSFSLPTAQFTGNDTGSFATLGNIIYLSADIVVDELIGSFNNQTVGNIYNMFIATVNSTSDITGTLATAIDPFTTVSTGLQQRTFTFAAPVTLLADQAYLIALVVTNGTGSTPCRPLGPTNPSSYANIPINMAAMVGIYGSVGRRVWYAQNSDAPVSVNDSGNNTGHYGVGLRLA